MHTSPNAATAPASSASPLDELAAVIATVSELTLEARRLSHTAQTLQERLPYLLDRFQADADRLTSFQAAAEPIPASDNLWVGAPAKTPAQVAADHANAADGQRHWWVMFVGREPGLYTTVDEANAQVLGVPGQQYRKHKSKREALDFYKAKHEAGEVCKWVELEQFFVFCV
ncbi:hypothetical protein K438DRAFT_1753897 [Mycena galopus ATCC 62051]|nr:hypothetical protein K438DRAFT_1753897 [Mycena galopus ATCC 62051]